MSETINPEPGKPELVNVAIRLDDAKTRTTLWQESFGASASEPLPVAVQAATRGGDTALCVIRNYPRLSRSVSDADLLTPLATFCGGWRGNGTPESDGALRRLAEMAPRDGEIQARLVMLIVKPANSEPDHRLDHALLKQADQIMHRAEAATPDNFTTAYARYVLKVIRGRPLAEREAALRAGLDREPSVAWESNGYQVLNGYLAQSLIAAGRLQAAAVHLRTASEIDPFSFLRRFEYVEWLAFTRQPDAAEALQTTYARWPQEASAELLLGGAVFYGAGDARQLLSQPPASIPAPVIACWRRIHEAFQSTNALQRAAGAAQVKACQQSARLSDHAAFLALAQLGDLDGAFAIAEGSTNYGPAWWRRIDRFRAPPFFLPPARALRADPRFLPLAERSGLMDYWRTTKTQPDVCEMEQAPFCLALRRGRE